MGEMYSVIKSRKYVFESDFIHLRLGVELDTVPSPSRVSVALLKTKFNEIQVRNEVRKDEKIIKCR